MTAAAPSKWYVSMIMGGLCHKSAWPVQPSEASYWLADRTWWHKPDMIIHMYCLTGAVVVIGRWSRIQLRSHHSHHCWPEPVCRPSTGARASGRTVGSVELLAGRRGWRGCRGDWRGNCRIAVGWKVPGKERRRGEDQPKHASLKTSRV